MITGPGDGSGASPDRDEDDVIGRQKTPILDRRIRIGVVGCGRISRNHFKAIGELADDLELVGACDNDPARLTQDFIPADAPRFDLLPDLSLIHI